MFLLDGYVEPTKFVPHLGQVILAHGVPRVCETVYPHFGHLQDAGPPIPCLCPPLPNPLPLLIF
jgi:hypothetical protein